MRATWNVLAVNFLAQAEERKNCAKNDSKRTKIERRRGRRGRWWWWWGGKVQWNTIVYSSETNINKHLTTCPKAIKYMISSWAAQRVMHFDLKFKSHTEATRQQSRYAMVTFNFVLSLTWAKEKKTATTTICMAFEAPNNHTVNDFDSIRAHNYFQQTNFCLFIELIIFTDETKCVWLQ